MKKKFRFKLESAMVISCAILHTDILYFRREAVGEYYNGDHDQDKADPGTEVDVL